MPTDLEIEADPSKAGFIMVDDIPVIVVSYFAGALSSYQVEVRSRFSNDASEFCSINQVQISKVIKLATGIEVEYSTLFSYDDITGLFTILDFNSVYSNYQVYFSASTVSVSSEFAPIGDVAGRPVLDITF